MNCSTCKSKKIIRNVCQVCGGRISFSAERQGVNYQFIIRLVGLIVLSFLSPRVFACEPGCSRFKDTCVCDARPETAPDVQPSDEKPPSDKMPSYQREGVTAIAAPSTAVDDARADQAKQDADREGKKAAGIK